LIQTYDEEERLMNKLLILSIAGLFLFGACGVSQEEYGRLKAKHSDTVKKNADLKNQLNKLSQKIKSLENEIEEEKNGPEVLLKQANQDFENKNYESAWEAINQLLTKHPGSNEVKEAKKLAARIEPAVKKIQEQQEQKFKEIEKEFRFSKSYNEKTHITTYHDRYYQYMSERIFLEIIKPDEGKAWVGFHIRSFGLRKLQISQFVFKTGKKTYFISPQKSPVIEESPSSPTTYTEEIVVPIDDNVKTIINAVINSDETIVAFKGRNNWEYTVQASEKEGLKSMLKAIKELGLKY
jgi:tetratricopeptide (TPR) repeat protein